MSNSLKRKCDQFNQPLSDLEEKVKLVVDSKEFSLELRARMLLQLRKDLLSFLNEHEDRYVQLVAHATEEQLKRD